MIHLFVCREYPPAPYPPGGIGTYVEQMSRLLAERGETVHVIAHRWAGAPEHRVAFVDGRLIVHRVALDEPLAAFGEPLAAFGEPLAALGEPLEGAKTIGDVDARIRQGLLCSSA